jgi:DNA-binding CsgD family transcriptional regulator
MLERISLFKEFGENSILLSLYRTHRSGHFTDAELQSLEGQSDLIIALTIRHSELVRSSTALRPSLSTVASQIALWGEALSPREVEACSALLSESSVKQAVRSTNIQTTTFITYRKRAFAKLRISTRQQLYELYEMRTDN